MTISDKTLTELRTIAQGLGVADIFSKSVPHLIQEIEKKHKDLIPQDKVVIPAPTYDARLMTQAPDQLCDKDTLLSLLEPYIKRGLKVDIGEETWRFSFANRMDTGTLRMPLRIALMKAGEILA